MYSKQEAKQIRQQFWTMFGKRYDRKWMLYDTKLKDVVLKFSFEDRRALVSIDITHEDAIFRAYYYEKLLSLKSILLEEVNNELIFEENYQLESGKIISRVFVMLEGVKIKKQTDWPDVYEFYYENMSKLEAFFIEYKDFIEA
ncbi:uncharacterized protein DUF4268 [Nonlabens dokdonensis]|jgi:hypothetical protein|uniref:DUF4268 domain-containing protein n=2 Tax=Nonlabens dokdonensis TaxID=328515 RepID=L7WC60_NONDD|nr:DUF4268 domain-containing protein [Nonlabens dokdonensis]AGC77684.1 hypothetical protein DDD_2557 [Nonlabens dokdonensis DSW-6]PZX39778.1 uncharacterized protein DUF4268 [Nonlabens dokdonensis]